MAGVKGKVKKGKKKKPEELRITPLEHAELDLTERDWQLSLKDIELADAKITNLTMLYHQQVSSLKEQKRTAQTRSEHMCLVKNKKLSEVEFRLRTIKSDFSFKDYLEQNDGTLVLSEDIIGALDPTASEGEGGGAPIV